MLPTLTRRSGRSIWNDPFDMMRDNWARSLMRDAGDEDNLVGQYPVDIHEDENHLFVEAEMPGFKKNEIEVTFENGLLTINATRDQKSDGKQTPHLKERRFHRVMRSFTLPNTLDESSVQAHLEDGVLHLKINKREEIKPRKIEVK